jgi:hypothetical protein
MTIDYSTNLCGPISMDWFRDRGLTRMVDIKITTPMEARIYKANIGDTVRVEDVTEYWCGGRIDIYGLDETEHYGGMSEYGLPIMDGESWNKLSEWLDEYTSEELTSFEDLIIIFERETNHKIRWADDEFGEVK